MFILIDLILMVVLTICSIFLCIGCYKNNKKIDREIKINDYKARYWRSKLMNKGINYEDK